MKVEPTYGQHLVIGQVSLGPGSEWTPKPPGWSVLHLASGVGYWMHLHLHRELATGSVVILSPAVQGLIRASQIGEARIHFFNVEPERLTGVLTLAEQRALREAAGKTELSFRFFAPEDTVAVKFRELFAERKDSLLQLRLQLLTLFIRGVSGGLIFEPVEPAGRSSRNRLEALLQRMPAGGLLDLDFRDLARQLCCSPRHLGRIFNRVVGTSFREKQAEVRLARAQELLATTQSKVCEVAAESGYQSLSLFNLMFKRRLGMTPGEWRRQLKSQPSLPAAAQSRNNQEPFRRPTGLRDETARRLRRRRERAPPNSSPVELSPPGVQPHERS